MVFRLSLLLALHIYSLILMFFNFLGYMFTLILVLLGLVFPSLVAAKGQQSAPSTSVSVKRESIQPMELDWIWAICVSLLGQKPPTPQDVHFRLFSTPKTWSFSANVSPLWCSFTILKATWLLATVGYVSAREVGKASAGIVGHVSRHLIKHIWSLGLIQIQTLRLDVLNRLEVTRFASHDHVTSQPFFGLRLGQITSFDPCLSHFLKLWTLALVHRLLDPDQRGGPCNDSLMKARKGDADTPALRSENTIGFEGSLQRLSQPKGHSENLSITTSMLSPRCGGLTTHCRRQTHSSLHTSTAQAPIPGFFVCVATNGYSAAKHFEVGGEHEHCFSDYSFDHARWLSTAIFDQFPSLSAMGNDSLGTMKSVQLQKPKALDKEEQMIFSITLLQIKEYFPSTPRPEYLQWVNRT